MGLTGLSTTSGVGSLAVSDAQVFTPTGVGATTSVGSIIPEIGVPLTAPSNLTASVGAITLDDMTIGLTGLEATAELGTVGFGVLAYKDIDITGNTSYTDVNVA